MPSENQPAITPMQYAGSGIAGTILITAFTSGDRWVQIAGLITAGIVGVALAWNERSLRSARLEHSSRLASTHARRSPTSPGT